MAAAMDAQTVGAGLGGVTLAEVTPDLPQGASALAAIFLDAFDATGETPAHLRTAGFLTDCRARLIAGCSKT